MNNKNNLFYWVIGLTAVYNFLFWQEKLGLNLLIFSGLYGLALYRLHPYNWRSKPTIISLFFTLVALTMVVLYNSIISKIAFFGSLVMFLGFVHQAGLKAVFYAIGVIFHNFILMLGQITGIFAVLKHIIQQNSKINKIYKSLIISALPISITVGFLLIYRAGNPIFSQLTDTIANDLSLVFQQLIFNFSWERFGFVLLGGYLIISGLLKNNHLAWYRHEQLQAEVLARKRVRKPLVFKLLALKTELQTAILLVLLVNGLLLVVNIIDILWLWVGFDYKSVKNLKDMVHEGTYMLIFSILLSMGILLYFFRNNLNFLPNNQFLKILAYCWIFQNGILVISVALRTYYYIHEKGLAYKRIGVLIFLALTLYGLYTLYVKIRDKKTAFYLFKTNTWAVYTMLILMSVVDWDVLIIRYNLAHYRRTGDIGPAYLLSLADKTLPIILENPYEIDKNGNVLPKKWYSKFERLVKQRVKKFVATQETYSALSWNYSDYQTYQYLRNNLRTKN
jgi:hypothetical protein